MLSVLKEKMPIGPFRRLYLDAHIIQSIRQTYSRDDTLPRLIEDDGMSVQSLQDYYIKLTMVLEKNARMAC